MEKLWQSNFLGSSMGDCRKYSFSHSLQNSPTSTSPSVVCNYIYSYIYVCSYLFVAKEKMSLVRVIITKLQETQKQKASITGWLDLSQVRVRSR